CARWGCRRTGRRTRSVSASDWGIQRWRSTRYSRSFLASSRSFACSCVAEGCQLPIANAQLPMNSQRPTPKTPLEFGLGFGNWVLGVGILGSWALGISWELEVGDWELTCASS